MTIIFEKFSLEELFVTGSTNDKVYKKLPNNIVRQYIKTVNYLRSARRVEDLFAIKACITRERRES